MRILTLLLVLGLGIPVSAQDAKNGLVLKGIAALASTPDGKAVVAYVASGLDGDMIKGRRWSEVRLFDTASGQYRVLHRAVTGASIPGTAANHTIVGFTAGGKKLSVKTMDPGGTVTTLQLDLAFQPGVARLKGMKDALADIERGLLKHKEFALPAPPWFPAFIQLLKDECGVEWVTVDDGSVLQEPTKPRAEFDGYNDVMLLEIERRFGQGILSKLRARAQAKGDQGKDESPQAEVHVYPKILTSKDKLAAGGADGKPIEIKSDSIFVWVDLAPNARFAHATDFILISAEGTRVLRRDRWPVINGKDFRGNQEGQGYKVVIPGRQIPLKPCHPGCFPAGTPIVTPTGNRPIDGLRVGDEVTTIRPDGTSVTGKVQSVFVTRNQLVRVETEDGILITTPTQPLVLEDGEIRTTEDLKPGDKVFRWQNGKRQAVTVNAVLRADRQDKVYNLVLGSSEVFVAGGFLARSKPPIVAVESAPSAAAVPARNE